MTKTIYNYHPETGEYIGEAQADESPLERGVFLIPAYATDIKPPETSDREVAMFASGQWHTRSDWRGVALFNTSDGSDVAIFEVGKTPGDLGATETPRPSEAHVWAGDGWQLDAALQADLERRAFAEKIVEYEAALDAHLDAVAHAHRYNDRFTFALRAGYAGPYQAEGVAFALWMDSCNALAFSELQRVLAGEAELPPLEAFIGALPPFVMPGSAS